MEQEEVDKSTSYAEKRVGSVHEESILDGCRSYCPICGYLDMESPTEEVLEWHGDSF